ncbi:MAG: hemerythrin domain-containing protein [Sciscionella sp.]
MSTSAPDLTMLRLIHAALRRDIARLLTGVRTVPIERGVVDQWELFAKHLTGHHTSEDRLVWPVLAERGGDAAVDVIAAMNDEHGQIEPVLVEVTDGFRRHVAAPSQGSWDELTATLERFGEMLEGHLRHEESAAIPLVEQYLTAADIERVGEQTRREAGIRGARVFLPWVLEEAPAGDTAHVLTEMPPPFRLLVRRWRKRHARDVAAAFSRPARAAQTRAP